MFRGIRDEGCSEDQVDGAEKLYDHAVTGGRWGVFKDPGAGSFF